MYMYILHVYTYISALQVPSPKKMMYRCVLPFLKQTVCIDSAPKLSYHCNLMSHTCTCICVYMYMYIVHLIVSVCRRINLKDVSLT